MKVFASVLFLTVAALCAPALAGDYVSPVPVLSPPPHNTALIDDSWSKAAKVPVLYDFTFARAAEPATVFVAQDSNGLDFAFEVSQGGQLTSLQQTNGAGVLNDDYVGVELWPQGTQGFAYRFYANAAGARYQTSSENSQFAPEWTASGRRTPGGYVVTMHIPFNVMRSGGSHDWHAQFERYSVSTNSTEVWEHHEGQRNAGDAYFAGTLTGIAASAHAAARPKPRLQIYALKELTTPGLGGNTARLGGDFSVPVTQTSSLLGAFHPDYSNVEVDQQSISPTAFTRRYSEVRPFFTQAGSQFNNTFNCTDCPTTLYTPSIPTFRQAYAYEGTQGPLSFAAYNVIGFRREDNAQVLTYSQSGAHTQSSVSLQRVDVNTPSYTDTAQTVFSGIENQHTHFFVSFNGGKESGTFVTDPSLGTYTDYGAGYVDKTTVVVADLQHIGAQFNPADGYVQQTDLNGLIAVANKTFNFSSKALLRDVFGSFVWARYHNRFGQTNSTLSVGQINLDFSNQLSLHLNAAAQGVQIYNGEFLPFGQNGLYLSYKGNTSTPSSVSFNNGQYYHGHLLSWQYVVTLPLAKRVNLTTEVDENAYTTLHLGEQSATQWLERTSLDWQFTRAASIDFGMRRIFGRNLPNAFAPPDFAYVNAGNVSMAFHFLAAQNEFYVVYGDPNSLSTTPALFLKWIRYIGAQKGT